MNREARVTRSASIWPSTADLTCDQHGSRRKSRLEGAFSAIRRGKNRPLAGSPQATAGKAGDGTGLGIAIALTVLGLLLILVGGQDWRDHADATEPKAFRKIAGMAPAAAAFLALGATFLKPKNLVLLVSAAQTIDAAKSGSSGWSARCSSSSPPRHTHSRPGTTARWDAGERAPGSCPLLARGPQPPDHGHHPHADRGTAAREGARCAVTDPLARRASLRRAPSRSASESRCSPLAGPWTDGRLLFRVIREDQIARLVIHGQISLSIVPVGQGGGWAYNNRGGTGSASGTRCAGYTLDSP